VRQRLSGLALSTPAWRPWLRLLEMTLDAVHDPRWDGIALRPGHAAERGAPALAGAEIALDPEMARDWVERLLVAANGEGSGRLGADAIGLLQAAIGLDPDVLAGVAAEAGLAPTRLAGLAGLAVMPLLQSVRRRVSTAPTWRHGYCPVCGAWPTLAEVRGLDQRIRLRCARCGGDWQGEWLSCPFCGISDHRRLGSLVSDVHGGTRKVETCQACRGYLKTFTTLQAWPPDTLAVEDLATVDLDVAAIERGYGRPNRPARILGTRLVPSPRGEPHPEPRRRGLFRRE
jgi:FdhE protein